MMKRKLGRIVITSFMILMTTAIGFAGTSRIVINKNNKSLTAPEAVNYRWFYNGEELKGENNQKITAQKVGVYKVELEFENGSIKSDEVIYMTNSALPHKIFVIGDSLSSIYGANYFPRTGWGQILQALFNADSIVVIDKAMSGRSSKSFYTDPLGWPTVINELGEGDYLFIQFGHNDQKDDGTDRYTDPYTTYQEYLSLYIDSARAHGAIPVLLTPINRNGWSGSTIADSHGDYPPAMRALATSKKVPLLDLHAKTKTLFESYGEEYTTNEIFNNLLPGIWVNYPTGNLDNTHTQEEGAFQMCLLIKEGIIEADSVAEIKILENALVPAGRIIAMPSPNLSGTITGRGVYTIGTEVTLLASPKSGYLFESWTEDDTIVSTDMSFSVKLNKEKQSFQSNFAEAYQVILKQSPAFSGFLTGNGFYFSGSEVTISARPKDGKKFINWQKDDVIVATDTSFTFTLGAADVTYTATFETLPISTLKQNSKSIIVKAFPNPTNGSVRFNSEEIIQRIDLISITGKSIYSGNYNEHEINLDISKYSCPGLIIARITTINGQYMVKLNLKE